MISSTNISAGRELQKKVPGEPDVVDSDLQLADYKCSRSARLSW